VAAGAGAGAAGAGAPPALTLVADSTRAPPLEIDIDAGAWQPAAHERRAGAPAPTLLGLRAAVRGTTVFRVLRADARDGDADVGRLVCVYTRHVAALPACVALDAAAADAADDDADAGADADADSDAAAIDLARFEAVRGVRASDDEVAAMLAGAVAAAATRRENRHCPHSRGSSSTRATRALCASALRTRRKTAPRAGDSDPPAPPAPAGAPPCAMGMSVRTAGWRYTRWTGYDYGEAAWGPVWNDVRGEELYSHAADDASEDPHAGTDFDDNELVNLAGIPTYAAVQAQLAAQLRAAFPPRSAT
jgi:hypothetical protein